MRTSETTQKARKMAETVSAIQERGIVAGGIEEDPIRALRKRT
jgi:hypothetical protein